MQDDRARFGDPSLGLVLGDGERAGECEGGDGDALHSVIVPKGKRPKGVPAGILGVAVIGFAPPPKARATLPFACPRRWRAVSKGTPTRFVRFETTGRHSLAKGG
ncbi:MAG: hypothetical protein AMXMBFR81_31050 [Chthonomonas sp.]